MQYFSAKLIENNTKQILDSDHVLNFNLKEK
jgi:hypothetical protein